MGGNTLFEDNLNLAKTAANHWSSKTALEYDDCHQLCLYGLYKASKTFKEGMGAQFSTWAITHMNNSVRDELRKIQRRVPELPLQHITDEDGETIYKGLEDYGECDVMLERIETSVTLSKVAIHIKGLLTEREWQILWLIAVQEVKQEQIAKIFGFQQPHVSRIMKGIRKKIMQDQSLCSMVRNLEVS